MIHRIYRKKRDAEPTALDQQPACPEPSNFQNLKSKIARPRASALITTLLVLVVLSTIVVAFMQSMSVERSVAKSMTNRYRAEAAAQSGLAAALAQLSISSQNHFSVGSVPVTGTNTGSALFIRQIGSTNTLETRYLYSTQALPPESVSIRLADGNSVVAYLHPLTNGAGLTNARFAFWSQPASFRQNPLVAAGAARDRMTNLSELPLVRGNQSPWPSNSYFSYSSGASNLVTIASANQLPAASNLGEPISSFDYAPVSTALQMTPEGFPRMNLRELKAYVDTLPLVQGPLAPRTLLVAQLLNETGTNSATNANSWGRGNLSFFTNSYSLTNSRQIVANILDYLDEDLIPTTDGSPGTRPPALDLASSSKTANDPNAMFTPTTRPTFIGTEARATANAGGTAITVIGHPYVTYVGSGLIFNSGANPINSTRILGWLQLVNPWEELVTWRLGAADGYFVDMQVSMNGTVTPPTRGASPQAPGAAGYFLSHGLAQVSGYDGSHSGRQIGPNSKVLFPREWHGSGNDLANGFYTINNPAISISNFQQAISVLRLVYIVNGQRYLISDLGVLSSLPRSWINATFSSSAVIKHPYTQQDWHFVGDPRFSFSSTNGWQLATSSGAANGPISSTSANSAYSTPVNPTKDSQQGLPDNSTWWQSTSTTNHFGTFAQGFRPSMPAGSIPMLSYSEFGFISTGLPWQTLKLEKRLSSTNDDYADWRVSDYVDLGILPRSTNSIGQIEINGQINPNTRKPSALTSLLQGVLSNASTVSAAIQSNATYPFRRGTDLFGVTLSGALALTNSATNEFGRERLFGQVAPALTASSSVFTVYSLGQALDSRGRPISTVVLEAQIELYVDSSSTPAVLKPRVTQVKFQ